MSTQQYIKSDLLKELKFKYSSESVVRFYSRKYDSFFAVHNVREETVVNLINFLIKHAEDQFYVSYSCYQTGTELFISPYKLQAKPYWFNEHAYTDTLIRSNSKVFIPVRIPVPLIDSLERLTEKLNVSKGDVISLALITEFSTNPWLKTHENEHIFDTLVKGNFEKRKALIRNQQSVVVNSPDWGSFHKLLSLVAGEDSCNPELIDSYIYKLKDNYRLKVEKLKNDGVFDTMKYTIKAYSLDSILLREDQVPLNFALNKLDLLFAQNLDAYRHAYKLHVHDPFIKTDFVYYPTLIGYLSESRAKSCNFSIPKNIFNWVVSHSNQSARLRSSMFIQALSNTMLGWEDKLNVKNFDVIKERFDQFNEYFLSLEPKKKVAPKKKKDGK